MGEPFGHYELLQPLATGGMGQLYLARNRAEGFQKLVVVKMLLAHLSRDQGFMTMFLDEARIAAQLNHPHICQIFELGEHAGTHYLAMEYVPGVDLRSLQQHLSERGDRLPPALACRVIADAASALHYAHELTDDNGQPLGIVHRDVSPSNVLVSFEGAVKLIDFGIAKAAGRAANTTAAGQLKGKFAYMSPEQAEGEPLDARSDLFSLGLVLHELLTGQRALQRDSDPGTLKAAREANIAPPSTLNSACTVDLDTVVMRALARRPEDRYANSSQFALALEDWLLKNQQPSSQAHLAAFLRSAYPDHKERSRVRAEITPNTGLDSTFVRTPSGATPQPSGLTRTYLTPERGALPPSDAPAPSASPSPAAPRDSHKGRRFALFGAFALMLASGTVFLARPGPPPVPMPPVPPAAAEIPTLKIVSHPSEVEVRVGGDFKGKTPLTLPIQPGTSVALTLQAPGLEPIQHTHVMGESAELRFTLNPKKVTVTVTSKPLGATVRRDGQSLGETPVKLALEPNEPVKFSLSLKGYTSQDIELVPQEGTVREVRLIKAALPNSTPFGKTMDQR